MGVRTNGFHPYSSTLQKECAVCTICDAVVGMTWSAALHM